MALSKSRRIARWSDNGTPCVDEGDIRFEGKLVFIGKRRWQVPCPISDLLCVGDTVVVLYDYMSGPRHHQFRNLEGFALDGGRLWTAQQPTTESIDSYVAISDRDGPAAWSFAGYFCTLNPRTGRLLSKEFTK